MTHRDLEKRDFVGKTVIDFECDAVNIIRFTFDDGSRLAIEVDAVGPGIYGMVACDECAATRPHTRVSEARLLAGVLRWANTPINALSKFIADGQDLYLRIVAEAAELEYDVVRSSFKTDAGIKEARRFVKSKIFTILTLAPCSILQVHDEVIVQAPAAVESADAHEKLEDHSKQPLHPQTGQSSGSG